MSDRKSSNTPTDADHFAEGEVTQLRVSSFILYPCSKAAVKQNYHEDVGDDSAFKHCYLETVILTASAHEDLDRKVSLTKKMKSASHSFEGKGSSGSYTHNNDDTASIGPKQPRVESHNVININAFRIEVGKAS